MRRRTGGGVWIAAAMLLCPPLFAAPRSYPEPAVPRGYPRSYRAVIHDAAREGVVVVYSTTDRREVADLLAAFQQAYPAVRIDYRELPSTTLNATFLDDLRAQRPTADLLWSAAMDLQTKLVNDGYAQSYASPEKPFLPPWALWKNEAWGVTAEPIVIAYNRRLVPAADLPRDHADLAALLRAKAAFYRGRIGTYDPMRSGTGYLYMSQDLQLNHDTVALMRALGNARAVGFASSRAMLDPLADGRLLLAYNVLGSYAMERLSRDPRIGIIMPADYTLLVSRIALIPNEARHPNAAKLFLDFLISTRGQTLLARRYMTPARSDVRAPIGTVAAASSARVIRIGPSLLVNLDRLKRRRFLAEWNAAFTVAAR